ncbi:hypothetical protein B1759_04565 [Rubrivirga sp. SAORIC476]|uniref:T9SS type A sorting domain-containing protein n=1 Tax=Rubrivirga sp. SAORIC476 TaxID=1961794 RepID=UPI000BA92D9E|nr:T9SS type A sorting domain-containing protein [Rubrivirga sp. SAORIC476]MAQ94132.1 T9SS C-terminal target domain-containing protein [Rhodothermaceae bacterium]MBC12291.1 T9SS C-terminal target domain-containing protein [Rhodothermaceae bacterium]PAP80656.1 hypothetical protein B1759_04565 [Rubrivirga sp. SAORIC476]
MRLVLIALLTLSASAQAPAPHAVPFASHDNALELAVAGEAGAGLTVAVAEAPAWLTFAQSVADAVRLDDEPEPVARLAFDVARTAPVGEVGEVVVEVRDGEAVVATHTVRLEVAPPEALALDAPYPNPSRGTITVPFVVPRDGPVRLAAYDVLGREVGVLAEGDTEAGAHEVRWPTAGLAPGVYLVRVVAGAEAQVRRVTVVR